MAGQVRDPLLDGLIAECKAREDSELLLFLYQIAPYCFEDGEWRDGKWFPEARKI